MRYWLGLLLTVCLLVIQPPNWASGLQPAVSDSVSAVETTLRRNYMNTSRYLISSRAIVLEGSCYQIMRLSAWLDEVIKVPHGRTTLEAIFNSGNQVLIRHSNWALEASGRTLGPATDRLSNGRGDDVVILFDARIPEQGSHWVFDSQQQRIEFTAVQNLYHELAHAKHLTNGTWRYADSEGQAIEEENIFRAQLGQQNGIEDAAQRSGIDGVQFWRPDTLLAVSE
jgi:hypothetical protein